MDVSVIIVNYNTKQLLEDCIKSIYKCTKEIDFEIIVSDNASSDGSESYIKALFPDVKYIVNDKNLGFGKANNIGLALAKGKYILYLNSDTILLNNALKYFYDYFETHPDVGALGANLLNNDGKIIHSYGVFPKYKTLVKIVIRDIIANFIKLILTIIHIKTTNLHYPKTHIEKKIGEVDYITGADLFLLNNKEAYFDEKFILYYEEVDLQYKLMQNKKNRYLIEGPQIIHLEGGSRAKNQKKSFCSFGNIMSYISMYIYCKKHISKTKAAILRVLIFILWCNPLYIKYTKQYFKTLFANN